MRNISQQFQNPKKVLDNNKNFSRTMEFISFKKYEILRLNNAYHEKLLDPSLSIRHENRSLNRVLQKHFRLCLKKSKPTLKIISRKIPLHISNFANLPFLRQDWPSCWSWNPTLQWHRYLPGRFVQSCPHGFSITHSSTSAR